MPEQELQRGDTLVPRDTRDTLRTLQRSGSPKESVREMEGEGGGVIVVAVAVIRSSCRLFPCRAQKLYRVARF
jgi:hypothetical protein